MGAPLLRTTSTGCLVETQSLLLLCLWGFAECKTKAAGNGGGEPALRVRLKASEQRADGTKVVSLEKAVVKLTEEVTWMKKHNAVLSAYVDAYPDVQAVAQVCCDSVRPQPFASASNGISPTPSRDRHRLQTLYRPCTSHASFLL